MVSVTAGMIKELRDKVGAGMMDCKTALNENDGDMEAAIDWLRTRGLAKAAKKAGRVASEGLVGAAVGHGEAALVEVNSETDFVARNEKFQDLTKTIAMLATQVDGDIDKLMAMSFPGTEETVSERIASLIASIGENISLRRIACLSVRDGVVASYVHGSVAPDLGRIGVLVGLESTGDRDELMQLGRRIAMHVAAVNPLATRPEEIDAHIVERERGIYAEQARASGKPEAIVEKMVEGRMRKFYEESVLLSQVFVVDGENSVQAAVDMVAKEIGAPIKVTAFVRMALGEGIEKKETDFAAEVAAAASVS